mmetsp:Transcript_16790/g.65592  ORF Transcript_16790/g.65592 Transcript_16790/m.65592 type:complete len:200 (-) Transcript_16790:418-1017(-)
MLPLVGILVGANLQLGVVAGKTKESAHLLQHFLRKALLQEAHGHAVGRQHVGGEVQLREAADCGQHEGHAREKVFGTVQLHQLGKLAERRRQLHEEVVRQQQRFEVRKLADRARQRHQAVVAEVQPPQMPKAEHFLGHGVQLAADEHGVVVCAELDLGQLEVHLHWRFEGCTHAQHQWTVVQERHLTHGGALLELEVSE